MTDTRLDDLIKRRDAAALRDAGALLQASPGSLHRLLSLLHCGRVETERRAAAVLEGLACDAPELLAPLTGRLFRIAAASEDGAVRRALARSLPKLDLGRGDAGRLAFVLEAWLDDADLDVQRDAMSALVALLPCRPELATRIRSVFETRAARGSPAARGHGLALLRRIREF
ncbi:MAG TPA: hypothetical protein VLA56_18670 [Pseudomonadales bacterium]|nr:hypothetical protein [Pseudomonadales bacterium]